MKSTYFPTFLWTLLITIASGCLLSVADHTFVATNSLKKKIEGLVGYKCNFAQGAHTLDPVLHEGRTLLCTVNAYFIYDTIHLIIPSTTTNPHFKLLPGDCFSKVFKDIDTREEVDPKVALGLEDVVVESTDKHAYIHKTITLSPFNTQDTTFYCICDNTAAVSGSVKGRMAFVEVRVLKYPYEIVAVNLTSDTYKYLPTQKTKADFTGNKLELTVSDGSLVVFICKQVDSKCFQRSNNKLYKSTKIVFHNDFAIFKVPFYVSDPTVTAECACSVDSTTYELVVKPETKKRVIYGCDFTDNEESDFTQKAKLSDLAETELEKECTVDLGQGKHEKLVGMHCPGKVEPDCFFQVYEYDTSENVTDTSKIIYVDNQLGISGLEFYDDVKNGYHLKIFSLVGNLQNAKSFSCVCKHNNKAGIMIVNLAASYTYVLSTMLIVAITVIFIIM